jgi:hypothetical protein
VRASGVVVLQLQTPVEAPAASEDGGRPIERIDILGGLIHQYRRAAGTKGGGLGAPSGQLDRLHLDRVRCDASL